MQPCSFVHFHCPCLELPQKTELSLSQKDEQTASRGCTAAGIHHLLAGDSYLPECSAQARQRYLHSCRSEQHCLQLIEVGCLSSGHQGPQNTENCGAEGSKPGLRPCLASSPYLLIVELAAHYRSTEVHRHQQIFCNLCIGLLQPVILQNYLLAKCFRIGCRHRSTLKPPDTR